MEQPAPLLEPAVAAALPRGKREPDVVVYLPGPPQGKGMPRSRYVQPAGDKPGFVHHYQDKETNAYEAMLRYAGEQAMRGRAPFACALRGRLTAVFAVPTSWSGKRTREALAGIVRPEGKPDDDNLLKVRDGLKGVVFKDDALFVETTIRKFYGEHPCWMLEVWQHTGLLL